MPLVSSAAAGDAVARRPGCLGAGGHGLSEYSCDWHDLGVLRPCVATGTASIRQERELRDLLRLIGRRQQEDRDAVFALGARLYAEKPGPITRRLAG